MNQFGLVQAVDRLGQRVVVAVAAAAHRRLDAGLGQALGVSDGHVLRTTVGVMDERTVALWLARIQRLLQRVEHEVGVHRAADAPAHDGPRVHVDHEGHVDEALPGRHIGEVRDPQLIRPLGQELPVHPVQRARRLLVGNGGSHLLAAPDTLPSVAAH
jgi:hypothetical protein